MTLTQTSAQISHGSIASRSTETVTVRILRTTVGALGAAVAFIVARDGSPPWQVARLVGVGAITVTIYALLGRGTRGQRASLAFATGCAAVPVGLGIGLPHLAKTGIHLVTVAGLVSLVGGLVLLCAGGAALVRIAPPWHRLLVGPALLAVVIVAVMSLGQAVAATNVPRTPLGSITPREKGLPYRDVEFQTLDGVTLSGWYVPSTNRAATVLLHGSGSTRSSVLDQAVVLARHGYGVLLFDARGHGRSGGQAMDFGWYGDEDVAAAVSFLRARPDVEDERIAAVGLSMGGEEAIGAAATDARIRAVVAEGATNRVTGDKVWLSDEYGWRGAIQQGLEWLLYTTTDVLTAAGQPIVLRDAVAAAAPRPVLLIAGGNVPEEGQAGRYIRMGSPETVNLWVVPESGHTAGLDTHPEQWAQRVTTFLDVALLAEAANDRP
jgi:pimeloyl-ACP methyl ester carboxylesterase